MAISKRTAKPKVTATPVAKKTAAKWKAPAKKKAVVKKKAPAKKKAKRKASSKWISKPVTAGLHLYRSLPLDEENTRNYRAFNIVKRGRGFAAVDASGTDDFKYKIVFFKGDWQAISE
jgi:hypothetical protein